MGFFADLLEVAAFNLGGNVPKENTNDLDLMMRDTAAVKAGRMSKGEFYRRVRNGYYK